MHRLLVRRAMTAWMVAWLCAVLPGHLLYHHAPAPGCDTHPGGGVGSALAAEHGASHCDQHPPGACDLCHVMSAMQPAPRPAGGWALLLTPAGTWAADDDRVHAASAVPGCPVRGPPSASC